MKFGEENTYMRFKQAVCIVSASVMAGCTEPDVEHAASIVSDSGTEAAFVKASSFGWRADDATECLQAAIDSGAKKIVVDRQAGDWIVRPLFVKGKDGLEIVVEDGVVVRAKKDEFKKKSDSLLTIVKSRNVTLRGEGSAMLRMNRADYDDASRYTHAEWRHNVSIVGGESIAVRDITLRESGGDGIYVRDAAKDVTIENVVSIDHYRQGISVISAAGLRVRRCSFTGTRGTAPQCGIDFEPNNPSDVLKDIVFEDCVFDGNAASGIDFYLGSLSTNTAPVSITMRRCVCRGNGNCGVTVTAGGARGNPPGEILLESIKTSGNGNKALRLVGFEPGGLRLKLKDCDFDARGTTRPAVTFEIERPCNFTGVQFENVNVKVDAAQPDLVFAGQYGTGVEGLASKIHFLRGEGEYDIDLAQWQLKHPGDPEALKFDVSAFDVPRLKAVSDEKLTSPLSTGMFRDKFTFLQSVPAAGDYHVRFDVRRISTKRQAKPSFMLRDRIGTDLGQFDIPEEGLDYVIHARGPSLYRFEVSCGGGLVCASSATAGCGVRADGLVHLYKGKNREYSFAVPAGGDDVVVHVRPQEACSAQLLDPSGAVVDEMPYGCTGRILRGKRKASDKGGVWRVKFPKVEEDAFFRIGAPAVPVATPGNAPKAVLTY